MKASTCLLCALPAAAALAPATRRRALGQARGRRGRRRPAAAGGRRGLEQLEQEARQARPAAARQDPGRLRARAVVGEPGAVALRRVPAARRLARRQALGQHERRGRHRERGRLRQGRLGRALRVRPAAGHGQGLLRQAPEGRHRPEGRRRALPGVQGPEGHARRADDRGLLLRAPDGRGLHRRAPGRRRRHGRQRQVAGVIGRDDVGALQETSADPKPPDHRGLGSTKRIATNAGVVPTDGSASRTGS